MVKKKRNIALFVISNFLVLYMRHNGILSVLVTFIVLFVVYKQFRKKLLIVSISLLASYFIITGPVYNAVDIEQHNASFAEKLGVPNNQICYMVINDADIFDDEMEFIDKYISIDTIEKYYTYGSFNKAKSVGPYNQEFLEENKFEYIKVWFSLVKKNFGMAVKAYYYTTRPIWKVEGSLYGIPSYNVGLCFFFASLSIIVAAIKSKRKFIAFVPLLVNVLGIMCLITGGETRFVFSNLTTSLPLILFSFIQIKKSGDNTAAFKEIN